MDYPPCGAGCTAKGVTIAFLTSHIFSRAATGATAVVKAIGDAFLVEFVSAVQAVKAAQTRFHSKRAWLGRCFSSDTATCRRTPAMKRSPLRRIARSGAIIASSSRL
jgi:hypothetical protein